MSTISEPTAVDLVTSPPTIEVTSPTVVYGGDVITAYVIVSVEPGASQFTINAPVITFLGLKPGALMKAYTVSWILVADATAQPVKPSFGPFAFKTLPTGVFGNPMQNKAPDQFLYSFRMDQGTPSLGQFSYTITVNPSEDANSPELQTTVHDPTIVVTQEPIGG